MLSIYEVVLTYSHSIYMELDDDFISTSRILCTDTAFVFSLLTTWHILMGPWRLQLWVQHFLNPRWVTFFNMGSSFPMVYLLDLDWFLFWGCILYSRFQRYLNTRVSGCSESGGFWMVVDTYKDLFCVFKMF